MHKIAAMKHGPAPGTVVFSSMFGGVIAKFKNAIRVEIPEGYQDETGFHFGVKTAEKEIKWPPVW